MPGYRNSHKNVFLIGDGYAWTCPICNRTSRRSNEKSRRYVRDHHKCEDLLPR